MKNIGKRLLALGLCLVLCAGVVPGRARAYSNTAFLNACSDSYKSGQYYRNLEVVLNNLSGNPVTDLLAVANSQKGYHEGDNANQLHGESNGSSNFTEYGRWINNISAGWCNFFVGWCFSAAGIGYQPITTQYAPQNPFYINDWKSCGASIYSWKEYKEGSVEPKAGDVVIYDTSSSNNISSSTFANLPSTKHIAIITNYNNGTFSFIEGNVTNGGTQVNTSTYTPNESTGYVSGRKDYIYAIIRPAYNNQSTNPSSPSTPYISISVTSPPKGVLDYGKGYGLSGNIISNHNLTLVEASIQDTSGNVVGNHYYKVENLGRNSYNIKTDGIDSNIKFGDLAVGSYKFVINVRNSEGKTGYFKSDFAIGDQIVRWYQFDVNGWLDGGDCGDLSNYGLFDITIDGEKKTNQNDAFGYYPEGTTYKIENIRATGIHAYLGVYQGAIEGTINEDKNIKLNFRTNANLQADDGFPEKFYAFITTQDGNFRLFNNNRNVQAKAPEYSVDSVWEISAAGDNYYKIYSIINWECFDVTDFGTTPGTNLQTHSNNNNDAQLFSFHRIGDAFEIKPKCTTCVVDCGSGDGAVKNAYMQEEFRNQFQLFKIEQIQVYNVHFDANGGAGVPSDQEKLHGFPMNLPSEVPSRTGYTFLGWSKSSTATSATYSAGGWIEDEGNTTLYAVWKANTYTVTFNANGGTGSVSGISVAFDNSFSLPTNAFTKAGYTFSGWYARRNSDNTWFVSDKGWLTESEISANGYAKCVYRDQAQLVFNKYWTDGYNGVSSFTFFAVWKPIQLKVIYHSNGATTIKLNCETINEETLSENARYYSMTETLPTGLWDGNNLEWLYLEKTGYSMQTTSWNTKADGTGISVDWYQAFNNGSDLATALGMDLSSGSKTITLYAEWKANTYGFSFDANGGSGNVNGFTVAYGENFTLPTNTFRKTGYSSGGWYLKRNEDNKWYVDGKGWFTESEMATNGYTKGIFGENRQHAMSGGWVEGYDGSCTYTLYAVWNLVPVTDVTLNKTSITLTAGGSETLTATVEPSNATNKNVTWASSDTSVATVSNGTVTAVGAGTATITVTTVDGDKTAECMLTVIDNTPSTYTLAYDANGGTNAPISQTKTHGEALTISTTSPTRNGYTFLGWAESANATAAQYQPGDSFTKDADTTLYAVWEKIEAEPEIGENDPQMIIEGDVARAGDTVTATFVLKNVESLKSIALSDITFDDTVLELVGGEWMLTDSILQNWNNSAKTGVIAFADNTDVNGAIFKLTFRVKDSAPDGDYALGGKITAKAKLISGGEANVEIPTVIGKITVISFIKGDVDGDDEVTSDDAIYLLYYTLLPDLYPVNQPVDYDGDGQITSDDAIYLLYYTLLPDLYPLN